MPQEEKNYNKVYYKHMSRKKERAKYRITTKAGMDIKGVLYFLDLTPRAFI